MDMYSKLRRGARLPQQYLALPMTFLWEQKVTLWEARPRGEDFDLT